MISTIIKSPNTYQNMPKKHAKNVQIQKTPKTHKAINQVIKL